MVSRKTPRFRGQTNKDVATERRNSGRQPGSGDRSWLGPRSGRCGPSLAQGLGGRARRAAGRAGSGGRAQARPRRGSSGKSRGRARAGRASEELARLREAGLRVYFQVFRRRLRNVRSVPGETEANGGGGSAPLSGESSLSPSRPFPGAGRGKAGGGHNCPALRRPPSAANALELRPSHNTPPAPQRPPFVYQDARPHQPPESGASLRAAATPPAPQPGPGVPASERLAPPRGEMSTLLDGRGRSCRVPRGAAWGFWLRGQKVPIQA